VVDIPKRVTGLEVRVAELERLLSSRPSVRQVKPMSPREFLNSKGVASGARKALLLSFYWETVEGKGPFTVRELDSVYRAAKEKLPANLSDMILKNAAKGFIMEAPRTNDRLKKWTLTSSGEQEAEGEN
jgi:hypothetical protein